MRRETLPIERLAIWAKINNVDLNGVQISGLDNDRGSGRIGVLNPLTEYVQYVPANTSLPTLWSNGERSVLTGTSLEAAVDAKLNSLDREYTLLREKTASIDWCKQYWWDMGTGSLKLDDWKQIDAMYRSRALDLPGTGHAMVPCVDMANHASGDATAALYETDRDGNAILYLRDGRNVSVGDEITITYGDEKGACEMLFSYGFLEANMASAKELFLDLDIPDDDPLRFAKKAISKDKAAPGFRLYLQSQSDTIDWEGSFVWLLCVNEEDGLEFKVLQNQEGGRELQALWKEKDITDLSQLLEILKQERLWDVFHLRAIATLQTRVEQQLFRLEGSKGYIDDLSEIEPLDSGIYLNAMKLRDLERSLLLHASDNFKMKKSELLESKVVQEYLTPSAPRESQSDDDFA
ncbi:hypothetical protein P7C71_g1268, partial [Lecanoromycetidae sp. Uapishka_2]